MYTSIPADTFANNRFYTSHLGFDGSLRSLPSGLFRNNPILRNIDIHNNIIASIGIGTFPNPADPLLGVRGKLAMSGNPSTCTSGRDTTTGHVSSKIECNCGRGLFSGGIDACPPLRCPEFNIQLLPSVENDAAVLAARCSGNRTVGSTCVVRCVSGDARATFVCGSGGQWASTSPLDCKATLTMDARIGLLGETLTFAVPKLTTRVEWDPLGLTKRPVYHAGPDEVSRIEWSQYINNQCIVPPSEANGTLVLDRSASVVHVTFLPLPGRNEQ